MKNEAYYRAKAIRLREVAGHLAEVQPDVAQGMLNLAEQCEADACEAAAKSADTGTSKPATADDDQRTFDHSR